MLFWGVLDPFLDLKGIKIFFFTNIYVYNYFLGQTKPFATSNRDRLDTPKINLNVQCTWHVPRVHKRVLKLVNFEVQKVQFLSAQDLRLYKYP